MVLAVAAGVAVAAWRGAGPLADPAGCSADVAHLSVGLDPDQAKNASLIAAIGIQRGLPARAVSIALAAAYQESKIRNLDYGDLDSLGLFQQRTSQGWGTRAQILDPRHAINAFYDALEKVPGYQTMKITEAAQRVQHSGYPQAYEQHAPDARALASALTGYSSGGAFTCVVPQTGGHGTSAAVESALTQDFGTLDVSRTGTRQDLAIGVGNGADGNRLGWSVAAYLVAHADTLKLSSIAFDGKVWRTGSASSHGWTSSTADGSTVTVSVG